MLQTVQAYSIPMLYTVELGYILDVAQSIANSAIERKESRGAHQRLDYTERDDVNYLKNTPLLTTMAMMHRVLNTVR